MIDCDHQWNWDKGIRFCLKCGQVRTFPNVGEAPRVIWQGFDDKRNPVELPPEDKAVLAHLARALGIKKASGFINIPMKILRAWSAAYCREKKPPKLPLSTKVLKNDLPAFPAFNDNWETPVQLEWMVTYLELAKLGHIIVELDRNG